MREGNVRVFGQAVAGAVRKNQEDRVMITISSGQVDDLSRRPKIMKCNVHSDMINPFPEDNTVIEITYPGEFAA